MESQMEKKKKKQGKNKPHPAPAEILQAWVTPPHP